MRRLLHFFAIGAALLLARTALSGFLPRERPVVEIVVSPSTGGAELEARIDEAILVEEGLRFGWAKSDPVIIRRLALNMAFARGTPVPSSDAAIDQSAVADAFALGMDRSDPVVRGRLAARVRQLLETPATSELPDDAALAAHLAAHRERFEGASRVEFVHVLLARDVHGERLDAHAEELLARLRAGNTDPLRAPRLGDVNPLLSARQQGSVSTIDRLFGSGFGEAVAALPRGQWSGPVPSAYGLHLVRVEARRDATMPALKSVRARVLADYLDETRASRIARRLRELRGRYSVRIVRTQGAS